MKTNKEKVFDFIVEYSKRFKTINDETPKLDTQFLSEKLEMRRSNLSSILNQLVDERKIEKTKGRPVLYYLSTDQEVQIENQVFDSLIGQDLSLKGYRGENISGKDLRICVPSKNFKERFKFQNC